MPRPGDNSIYHWESDLLPIQHEPALDSTFTALKTLYERRRLALDTIVSGTVLITDIDGFNCPATFLCKTPKCNSVKYHLVKMEPEGDIPPTSKVFCDLCNNDAFDGLSARLNVKVKSDASDDIVYAFMAFMQNSSKATRTLLQWKKRATCFIENGMLEALEPLKS